MGFWGVLLLEVGVVVFGGMCIQKEGLLNNVAGLLEALTTTNVPTNPRGMCSACSPCRDLLGGVSV